MKRINQVDVSLLDRKVVGGGKPAPKLKSLNKIEARDEDVQLLQQAERYFADMQDFYERRRRVRKYLRGQQWSDYIDDPDNPGTSITEEDYIKNQGKVPLKQNLMRTLEKSLSGQYQGNPKKSMVLANKRGDAKQGEVLTNTLFYVHQINHGQYLDARNFSEFLMSGMPIQKVCYKFIDELERPDVYIENVNPRRICINTDVVDQRLNDLRFVCEIMDVTIEDLISAFAKTKQQAILLRDLYLNPDSFNMHQLEGLKADGDDALDFYVASETNKCRVYSIWYRKTVYGLEIHDPIDGSYEFSATITPEEIEAENEVRRQKAAENGIIDVALIEYDYRHSSVWFFKYLTNHGYCLAEGESPYEHGEHPYVIFAYPLVDGEIWGPLEDVLDQQRYVNRMITMMDMIISAGAKGVWLIPKSAIPEGWTEEEYKKEIVKVGGAVVYNDISGTLPNPNKPFQVTNQAFPAGINELLASQIKFMMDISGVQPSIQGMPAKSGTPASLYAQEAQNAATTVIDIMNSYGFFIKKRDWKILKTILQFYKEKRYLHIAGTDYEKEALEFDPEAVDGIDFDLTISEGNNTPIYRALMEDMLIKLLEMQQIGIEQYLQNTSYPFADKMLEAIRQQKDNLMNGMAPGMPPQELIDQVNAQADPRFLNAMNNQMITA
jgi:hypothetical protein